MQRIPVVIASPLEPELVERLRCVDDQIDVRFEPELLPTPRYPTRSARASSRAPRST